MHNTIKTAIVLATQKEVKVFRLSNPIDGKAWALYDDGGKTTFNSNELKFKD